MNRMMKGIALSGLIGSCMLPGSGFASEIASDINVSRSYNMPKFLLGATIGSADHDRTGDSEAAYSLFAGLTVIQSLAVEIGWINLGEVGSDPVKAKSSATFVDLVGTKKLSTQFGFFGKVGLALWKYEVSGIGDDNGADILWGLGMQWRITKGLHARLGMDFYSMDPKIKNKSYPDDTDVFNLGIMYGF